MLNKKSKKKNAPQLKVIECMVNNILGKNVFQDIDGKSRRIKTSHAVTQSFVKRPRNATFLQKKIEQTYLIVFGRLHRKKKKLFILNLVEQGYTKKKFKGVTADSRRSVSYKYHLRDTNDKKIYFCKKNVLNYTKS